MIMNTPLGVLMRVEATLWMRARGGGIMISLDDFYALIRSHEWLILGTQGEKNMTVTLTTVPKVTKISEDVCAMIRQLSEEERLLFDFVAASAWESKETPNLYPLYNLHSSSTGKIQLEILQQPQQKGANASTTKSTNTKVATRSEVLGNMYHLSRKYCSLDTTGGNTAALHNWWRHAKSVAQMILNHRGSMSASVETGAMKTSSLMMKTNSSAKAASPTKIIGTTMTLEERVRARSLQNPTNTKTQKSSKTGEGLSSQEKEIRSLLELADALRSYSQRRGLLSSSRGGGSALDRLKNRGSGGAINAHNSTKNIARLTVTDLIKDARTAWKSVVNETASRHESSIGSKSRGARATTMVTVDLSRVLFLLRLKMVPVENVSDRRQMELQLLALLDKLATLVPDWIQLRKAPSTLTSTETKPESSTSTNGQNNKLNIRHSIIIIRNDSVDYVTYVRAKLGGRVHNVGSTIGSSKAGESNSKKRSLQAVNEQQNKVQKGTVGVADAIVPPSFRRIYGKALGLDEEP